jgi:hypothetical protein
MASGALDANGIYQYGEDDTVAPVSSFLNLLASSTSTQLTADRSRLTGLETEITPLLADSGWVTVGATGAPAYGSGWSGYSGGGYSAAAFRKIGGTVQLNGVAAKSSWSSGDALFTLPAGYRPSRQTVLIMPYAGGITSMIINTAGAVQTLASGSSSITLAGGFAL